MRNTLRDRVSRSTAYYFEALASTPAAQRVAEALQTTLWYMYDHPTAELSDVLWSLGLEARQCYEELCLSDVPPDVKFTAEQVLCIREREMMAAYCRKAFSILRDQPFLKPMD